jgi:hypothetical protein
MAIFRLYAACCAGDMVKLRMQLLAGSLLLLPVADSLHPAFAVAEMPPAVITTDKTR